MVREAMTRQTEDFINGHPIFKQDQYSPSDLVTILKVSRATIYKYINNEEFPLPMRKRRINSRQFITGADLMRWYRAYK
jgi:predicted DNA-binding transcriptional regulator AlpA